MHYDEKSVIGKKYFTMNNKKTIFFDVESFCHLHFDIFIYLASSFICENKRNDISNIVFEINEEN